MKKILAFTVLLAIAATAGATDYFMTKAGAGNKDGLSWETAKASSSLTPVLNTLMQPGDTLYLEADHYGDQRFNITTSGTADARKALIGVDRGKGYSVPTFVGTQTTRDGTTITLGYGASYWTIQNLRIERRLYGIDATAGGIDGLILDRITVRDVRGRCFVFTDCDDILIQDCRAERYNEMGFRFNSNNERVTIRRCVADASGTGLTTDSAWKKDKADSPVGFDFHTKNSSAPFNTDILLEDCESLNNDEDTENTEDYEQGDGFKMERGNDRVTIRRCRSYRNQDAGYDLKGANQVIEDSVGANSGMGFKVWYNGVLTNCAMVGNGTGFILAAQSAGHTVTLNRCTIHSVDSKKVGIQATTGNTAIMNDCIISYPGAAGTYTTGTMALTNTVKLSGTAKAGNGPRYIQPLLPWYGDDNSYDNATYGSTRGYMFPGSLTVDPGGTVEVMAPEADTYVTDGTPTVNYGSSTELAIKDLNTPGYDRVSYLRFPLTSLDASFTRRAILKVTVTGTGSEGGGSRFAEIREVPDNTWTESGMTWETRPATSTYVTRYDAQSSGVTYLFDVTHQVNKQRALGNPVSFALTQETNSNRYVTFASREHANAAYRPVLEIIEPAAAPPQTEVNGMGRDGRDFEISLPGYKGRTYRLLRRDSLEAPAQFLGSPVPGGDTELFFRDFGGANALNRFYQVDVTP
jgi:hypothetical protein